MTRPYIFGLFAIFVLLAFYLGVLTLVSGWSFAAGQLSKYWYFIISLAIGFGIQVGLFNYIRQMHQKMSAGMVTATGTTSALSMISCCTHYLVNLLPILGIAGIVTLVSAYQIQLFWLALAFNFVGIIYMVNKVHKLNTA